MSADPQQADPFARTQATNERFLSALSLGALAVSVAYVSWRVLFTLGTPLNAAALLLVTAEILAVVVFGLRVRSARVAPVRVIVSPEAPIPDTAAVVDATGTSIDELRTTLVSLRRVVGVNSVFVVDPDESRRIRTIAERFHATVVEPTLSFDDAVRRTGTSWVLVLRSGDLPMPDLVTVCAPRCSSPDVAIVQVGIEEAEPTSFDHDPDGHWALEPFEQQVIRPSLAARGSIPWYGDGPALVRRAVVAGTEASRSENMLDNSRQVGLDVIRAGMTVTHLPLTLARVRGPNGLGESLSRRHRRNRAALRVVRRRELSGVARTVQAAHLLALLPFLSALQRFLLVASAFVVLALAQVPIHTGVVGLAVFAIPSYLLRWHAHLLLGRGRLRPLAILRSDLRSFGVDLSPFGRARAGGGRTGLTLAVMTVLVLVVSMVVASLSIWQDWPDRLPITVSVVALAITAAFLGVAIEVLLDAAARRQRRTGQRVRLGLVTCRLEEHDGQLVDLSTGGAGVVVAAPPAETPAVGDVTTLAFRIPDADGAWRNVSTLVHVAHRRPDPDGGTRIGLSFDDPTDAPLDPVIEFLTIDRRLVALGRHEAVSG